MDLSEVGAEFGSCGHRWEGKRTKEMQNRLEMQFSRKDRLAQGSYDGEVEGWGHPPNFVRPCIEGEHKFGGWIWQRWVPSSAVVGIDGRANVLRECYATLLLVHLRSPISSTHQRFSVFLRKRGPQIFSEKKTVAPAH